MKIAVIPGSFDPITLGHVDLVERAAKLFDHVIVVAMINDSKSYLFSEKERLELISRAIEHIRTASADFCGGMLWKYAQEKNACAIVKGMRDCNDAEYEMEMAKFNMEKNPAVETVILPTKEQFAKISSSFVKKSFTEGINVATMIPEAVLFALNEKRKKC